MRILATAKMYGCAQALVSPLKELERRGHQLTIYATGNESERKGFQDLPFQELRPEREEDCFPLVRGYQVVITGLSGYQSPDGWFLRAAQREGIPVVAVNDQDVGYVNRLGRDPSHFPTLLALMHQECFSTLERELGPELASEAKSRARVIGYTAFDHYQELRENFDAHHRQLLRVHLGLQREEPIHVHFTQNIPPDSVYMQQVHRFTPQEKMDRFAYELQVTNATFTAAAELGLLLVTKPHPGEEYPRNFTQELAQRFGFSYISANACNSLALMLAAESVTAGRSTCLAEATLLDRPTGGILPGLDDSELAPFPPLALGAIPFTQHWDGLVDLLARITSPSMEVQRELTQQREKFSVDGKAGQRCADRVEEFQ